MRIIQVKKNQSLFDIAVQEYGSFYGVHWIVEDNEDINSVLDNVFENDTLLMRNEVMNGQVKKHLSSFTIATINDAVRTSGIGFWAIEKDFEIQ